MIKKIFYTLGILFLAATAFGQTAQAPYLRFKNLPPAKFVTADSTAWFIKNNVEKKKKVLIIVFSPECDHCQHETEELVKNIDRFKDIHIVMATVMPIWQMSAFIKNYGLNKYKNITVVKDPAYFLPTYYDIHSIPYHAFYDKDKKLITGFEGTMSVDKILKTFETK